MRTALAGRDGARFAIFLAGDFDVVFFATVLTEDFEVAFFATVVTGDFEAVFFATAATLRVVEVPGFLVTMSDLPFQSDSTDYYRTVTYLFQ